MTLWLPWSVSFAAGLILVPVVREIARERDWIAPPKPDRWHGVPTASMGGIAIWMAVLAGVAAASIDGVLSWKGFGLLAGGTLLCAVGAVDDRLSLKPATKLVAQLVAAAIAVAVGYKIRFFQLEILNLVTSFFWIVAITNAVNLLDNMDGLAAGIVMIGAGYIGWMHAGTGDGVLALTLVGSLSAFLFFNFNPASIFMGDSGSMFIGYTLAGLSLAGDDASNIVSFVAVPAATLLVPILDTSLVTVTRLLRGRSVAEGGRDHASHRLVTLGLSEREAVGLLWILALVAGASANLTKRFSYELGLGLLPVIILGFGLLGIYLSRLSFRDEGDPDLDKQGYVRLALDISYKRRVLEVLLDFVLIVLCYYLAYGLRFEFDIPRVMFEHFEQSLPVVVAMTMLAFFYEGVYRGFWTYVSAEDLTKYVKACTLAVLLTVLSIVLLHRFDGYPRSVFAIYGLLMFIGVGGTRVSFRLMDETLQRRRPGCPVLIVGAGSGGEIAVRELLRNPGLGRKVAGFADDDRLKQGRRIHGYPVLGGTEDLDRLRQLVPFQEVVLATQKLSPPALGRLKRFCERRQLPLRRFRVELLDDVALAPPRAGYPRAAGPTAELLGATLPRYPRRDKLRKIQGAIVAALISWEAVHAVGCGAAVSRPPAADDSAYQAEVARLLRERSQPADRVNYVIGAGDKIDVRVEDLQELTGTWEVPEKGTVVFPLLGSVELTGSTEREAAERIRGELTELMVAPRITLSVSEFHGQQVSVIGAVGKPGVYAIRGFDETIVDVITEAGGVRPDAATRIYFTPGTHAGNAAGSQAAARLTIGGPPGSFGSKNKAVPIDVAPLYRGQEVPALRIPVRGGDVILIPQSGEVYVDGWVNKPGAFPVKRASTLSEAIVNAGDLHFAASSGPLTLQRADADGEVKTYRIDYQRIVSGQDPDLPLDTGDKIDVASNPVKVVPWAVYAFFRGIVSVGVSGSQTKVYGQ